MPRLRRPLLRSPGHPPALSALVPGAVLAVVLAVAGCSGGSGDTPVAATTAPGPAGTSALPGSAGPSSASPSSAAPSSAGPGSAGPSGAGPSSSAPGGTPVAPTGTPLLAPLPPAGTTPVTEPGTPGSTAPGTPTAAPSATTPPVPVVTPPPPPPGLTPVPSIPVTTAPPVAPTATATATSSAGRVLIAITSVTSVKTAGQGPGEITGQPAIAVTLTIRNDTRAALDLGLVSVTASYGTAATPAVGSSGVPSRPFTGTLRAGSAGNGVYVFRVPPAQRALVDLAVDYLAGAPVVLFRGRVG